MGPAEKKRSESFDANFPVRVKKKSGQSPRRGRSYARGKDPLGRQLFSLEKANLLRQQSKCPRYICRGRSDGSEWGLLAKGGFGVLPRLAWLLVPSEHPTGLFCALSKAT